MWNVPINVHRDAQTVINELASNAIRLYPGLAIKAWAACPESHVLEVAVWDPDQYTYPTKRAPTSEDENGRGLWIVEDHSTQWGFYCSETTNGKVVWVRFIW